MFGTPKPVFGQGSGTFGGFNTSNAASPFGQNTFGKPASTGFSATPTFGATTAGSTLFGTPASTSGGLFGQPAAQTGFGFPQNTSGGLFGASSSGGSLFGQTAPATTFGTKPGFGGFGTQSTASGTGLFGANTQIGTGLFGQPSATATSGTTGLFGSTAVAEVTGFGSTAQSGTYIKYVPVSGTDMVVKNGQAQNINTQHHCITCMKEYENKSLEELRYEDYLANRKGGTTSLFGTTSGTVGSAFGQPSTSNTLFGQTAQDKPGGLFGQNTSAFGQSSIFGKPATSGFGAQPATSSNFAFGSTTTNQSTSLFGASKPFGATATPAFSTTNQTNAFRPAQPSSFNTFSNLNQPGNIFGTKPPENNAFGMPQTSTTGGFGTFGATPAQNTGDIFGAKPGANFGTAAPVFGNATPFGAPAASTGTGTLFPSFGAKPADSGVPTFGGFNTSGANTGLGGGLNLSGGGLFGNKPAGGLFGTQATQPGLFGNTGTNQLGTGLGTLGTGTSTLGGTTGLGTFGAGGLGTSGNWGGTNLGTGLGLNTGLGMNTMGGNTGANIGAASGAGVHDRLITLTRAYPYGYSPLLKDISPNSEKIDEALKPTNPAAQRAVMESDKYKVSPGITNLRVKPLNAMSKKSLFDGLEEDDPSIQKFTLKPSVKRLQLKPKPISTEEIDVNYDANNVTSNDTFNEHNASSNHEDSAYVEVRTDSINRLENLSSDNETYRKRSPSNIQKRIGLDSPRGGILKNSANISSVGDSANNEDMARDHRFWLSSKSLRDRSGSANEPGTLNSSFDQLFNARASGSSLVNKENEANLYPDLSSVIESTSDMRTGLLDVEDKENIESPIANDEDEPSAIELYVPHPTGIKLTRPGYYTIPSLDELKNHIKSDGKCIVPQFTIGRRGYGNVFFDCEMDVSNLDLDQLVHILNKEIVIYPDDDAKPPEGEGLNRPAQVTLDRVYPIDKTLKIPITQPDKLAKLDYEGKLRRVCNKHGTRFIEYRPQTGSWVFKVPHFSKYGLTNSDEEDDAPTDATQQKKSLQQPVMLPVQPAQIGLGGFVPGMPSGLNRFINHSDQALDSVSADIPFVSRLSGITKGLAMDTSEENSMDSAVLNPEINQTSFYEPKDTLSPTSQLAKFANQSSHTLQLMKASFFNVDTDMDDAASVTDQMVPQLSIPMSVTSMRRDHSPVESVISAYLPSKQEVPLYTGLSIRQPIVKPKSVVLQFHKKVLPFGQSVSGRITESCYADLSMAFSRCLKVGWGPANQLVTLTTSNSISDKVLGGDLLSLEPLLQGRMRNDSSRQLAIHLRIAGGGPPAVNGKFKENLELFLKICLQYSEIKKELSSDTCPLITPSDRQLDAAKKYCSAANCLENGDNTVEFGVDFTYWREVWSLCSALWGEYGNPDADPNIPSVEHLLGQHAAISNWLQKVATSLTNETTVYSLIAAKKLYEACELAQKDGDYYMATMFAFLGGEMRVRNLAARQLALWRDTCADELIDSLKLSIYSLIAGQPCILINKKSGDGPTTLHVCNGLDWIRAFALHFWYICEPIATIGDAVRAYEKSFLNESRLKKRGNDFEYMLDSQLETENNDDEDEFDLTQADSQDILHGRVAFPSPPHEVIIEDHDINKKSKKILDLRYQLMALRAFKWRSIDSILNPISHTPDPLDYRLSWFIQQFLEGLGYSHWSENGLYNILTGFASQLESHGMWYWSVFVLQHIKNHKVRNQAVKEIIMRYAGTYNDTDIDDLLNTFGIPEKWIYQAKALKAKYNKDSEMEAHYLILAEQFADAHHVIINQIAPSAILNEKPNLLRKLLKPLIVAGTAGSIPNWNNCGHLLLEYLDICDEINILQEKDVDNISYHCEALKEKLATACTAVTFFPTPTLKHTVARCEIGARLASIACTLAGIGAALSRVNISPLLNLLNRLDLPPDYIRKFLDKVRDNFIEEPNPIMYSDMMSDTSEESDSFIVK